MLATTNLVAVSAQLGSQIYVAGVSGPTMFLNMQRSDFGDIQVQNNTGILFFFAVWVGSKRKCFYCISSENMNSLTYDLRSMFYGFSDFKNSVEIHEYWVFTN